MSQFCGFEITDSEELGRCVIAKRDFRAGDVILDEAPILISPVGREAVVLSCPNLLEVNEESKFDCVGCFKTLLPEDVKKCGKCSWPVCCNGCGVDSLHAKYECRIFEEKKVGVSSEVFACIYILRGVLMSQDEENPVIWEQINSLCSSHNLNQGDIEEEIPLVARFLKERFQMDVDGRIIGQIIGAVKVNAFGMSGEDPNGSSYRVQALYRIGSMFAHSCAYNAKWVILPFDYNGVKKWNLRVYCRRNILCNEPINISYVPDIFDFDTAERKSYIAKNYHFNCKCERCNDKTEFSFYTEAIICPSCGDENLTADDTSDEFSNWTCNHCGESKPYTFAQGLVQSFDPSVIGLDISSTWSNEKCGLSKNHREIILATYYWIEERSSEQFQELFQNSTECADIFVKFMKMETQCLKVLRMFGTMADVVGLELWFAQIIAAYYFKTTDFLSIPYDPYLPEEKLKVITAICSHLKIAYDIVEWSPYNRMYLHWRKVLIDGYKFWNDELSGMKDKYGVGMSHSSNELNGAGDKVINAVARLKSSPHEVTDVLTEDAREESSSGLLKQAEEMDKMAVGLLDLLPCGVFTSPGDSSLFLKKPSVSLLTEFDFYLDG